MLQTLELTNLRSYKSGLFEFSPAVNIIVGPNASGKTNLLEAIYMVAKGVAFKSDDRSMVRYDEEWARISATFQDGHARSVKIVQHPFKKSFVFDDVEKFRFTERYALGVVLFEPMHMLLLSGEPDRRRAYIDELLAQTEIGYLQLLKDYKRTLLQRNRLLKNETIGPEHLFVWDVRLSDLGGKIVEKRLGLLEQLRIRLSQDYRSVSGNQEVLGIEYDSKLPGEQYANAFLQGLTQSFALDRMRGYTGTGPHRDDISISLNGASARESASRGETRSIVLALKIAELRLLEEKTGKKPLLLLDDVFSELDGKRRRTLANTLQNYQVFITTTDADVVIEHFSKTCNIIPL
jgi:DNA replication and repair protein RecF